MSSQRERPITIVTGAAGGIGRGIAQRLVSDGALVVIGDSRERAAQQTASEIGCESLGRHLDVTSRASIDLCVKEVIRRYGQIDVLVNNAGWDRVGPFVESHASTWDQIIEINLFGTLHMTHAVIPHMIRAQRGAVINIGSDAARVGSTGEAVYSAAKAGVIAFTKTLARELAPAGVRANVVCPGPTDTPLFRGISEEHPKLRQALERAIPLRRLAQPKDIAAAVAFFASPDTGYITGQTLSVSGGLTMQ